jgi:hypothetical protein
VGNSFNLTTGVGNATAYSEAYSYYANASTLDRVAVTGLKFMPQTSGTYYVFYDWQFSWTASLIVHPGRIYYYSCGCSGPGLANATVEGRAFGYLIDQTTPLSPTSVWPTSGNPNATFASLLLSQNGRLDSHQKVGVHIIFPISLTARHKYSFITGYDLTTSAFSLGNKSFGFSYFDLGTGANHARLVSVGLR